jgi:hypothetical protein
LHDPAPTKIVKNADKTEEKKPAQQPEKRSLEPSLPEWKCTAGEKLEVKKELSLDYYTNLAGHHHLGLKRETLLPSQVRIVIQR